MGKRLLAGLLVLAIGSAACGGEEPLTPDEARSYFENIDLLLADTLAEHREGDVDGAAESAGEAYLENFEHLEHDLEEADAELMERIERLMGPGLRREIQQGMSQEELEARIAEVQGLLIQARAELGVS